jgi:hypothetical protein
MPTDNYDASLVAQRKAAATLRAFKNNLVTYQNTVNYNIVRKQQATAQTAQVVADVAKGCVCDSSLPGYTRRITGLTGVADGDNDYDLYNPIYENDTTNNSNEGQ